MFGVKKRLEEECEYYRSVQARYLEEVKQMPDGNLNGKIVGNHYYFYLQERCVTEKGVRYVERVINGPNVKEQIEALKRKRFLLKSLNLLDRNIKLLERFLLRFTEFDPAEIEAGLSEVYRRVQMEVTECQDGRRTLEEQCVPDGGGYEDSHLGNSGNPFKSEKLIHVTGSGLRVRSKSEAIIADLLDEAGVPFQYEAKLKIGEKIIYPDFKIPAPDENCFIYWEHFGLTNSEDYLDSMDRKLKLYRSGGITPWDHLITTYDTPEGAIDARKLRKIIRLYFVEPC